MTYSRIGSLLSFLAMASILSLTIAGCMPGPSPAVTAATNPSVWVASSGPLQTFGVADNPATPQAIAAAAGATSLLYFQQGPLQGALEEGSTFGEADCGCGVLFYIAGGKLNVAFGQDPNLPGIIFAPTATSTIKTQAVTLGDNPTVSYLASDGGGGTPIFVSSPADHTIRTVDGATLNESRVFGGLISVQVPLSTSPSAPCSAYSPGQLAVPYLSMNNEGPNGTGTLYALATGPSGASLHALTTSLFATATGPCGPFAFTDLGDVGADASSIAAEGSFAAVTNPTQNLVYVFGGASGPATVKVATPAAVTIANGTAWVTQNIAGTTTGSGGSSPAPNSGIPSAGTGVDCNYSVIFDSTGEAPNGVPDCSQIVKSQPSTWVNIPGAKWIGPSADQSTTTRASASAKGSNVYELDFNLTGTTQPSLEFTIAADDFCDVSLNGVTVFTHTNTSMSASATKFTVSSGYKSGENIVKFSVSNNNGGPTGLSVAIAPANNSIGNLVPIDLATLTVGTAIPVGKCPTVIQAYRPETYDPADASAAANSVGPGSVMLYISNTCDSTISVVDTAQKKVVQTVKLPAAATAITIEP